MLILQDTILSKPFTLSSTRRKLKVQRNFTPTQPQRINQRESDKASQHLTQQPYATDLTSGAPATSLSTSRKRIKLTSEHEAELGQRPLANGFTMGEQILQMMEARIQIEFKAQMQLIQQVQ